MIMTMREKYNFKKREEYNFEKMYKTNILT